jgi:threonyl-tRNA synthetase
VSGSPPWAANMERERQFQVVSTSIHYFLKRKNKSQIVRSRRMSWADVDSNKRQHKRLSNPKKKRFIRIVRFGLYDLLKGILTCRAQRST